MKRLFRRMLRRCGIDLPFPDVVCPHHTKTIRTGGDGRAEVIDRRSLVFLDLPEADDMWDFVPGAPDESVGYVSSDSIEVGRTSTRTGTRIGWIPREPIVRYALYDHQYGWMSPRSAGEPAMYGEYRCEMKTGAVDVEFVTAGRFEAAVAFKRPRWPLLSSERSVIKYALAQLDSDGARPAVVDDGSRMQWKLLGPKTGERYIYVAFVENGLEQWRKRLEPRSFAARIWGLLRRPAQA